MHIPDGILSPAVWGASAVVSAVALARGVRYSRTKLDHRTVPVMGAMAAFVFASQMINFPLLGAAASGHLIGGALCAILFGFWPATLIMTTVVAIQAFVFQDGGVTALGANVLLMGILAPAVAALAHRLLRGLRVPMAASGFISAWLSVVCVALCGAGLLALSGVIGFVPAASALLFWHAIIGVGEGLITAVVLPFALRSSFHFAAKEGMSA
ncbi:energy-coupling factor ABC transporter permease [Paenibacillus sp.]|uniref:energy-coupling factor ABC transporter permease n=1 Tax=Paenibacillus sp. TaxID=58172 RepID=UPI002D5A7E9C|nr:energy-coupling factor ABC transporter permease [Paenibacillus sp.]HZG88397.1 energy-coupling factor ABC transporter permease [Paenibacillus sp.]